MNCFQNDKNRTGNRMPFPQYSDQNQQAPEPRNLVNRTISYQQKSFSHS
jgi:hypothetical protein